jgi:hypothetical protein
VAVCSTMTRLVGAGELRVTAMRRAGLERVRRAEAVVDRPSTSANLSNKLAHFGRIAASERDVPQQPTHRPLPRSRRAAVPSLDTGRTTVHA